MALNAANYRDRSGEFLSWPSLDGDRACREAATRSCPRRAAAWSSGRAVEWWKSAWSSGDIAGLFDELGKDADSDLRDLDQIGWMRSRRRTGGGRRLGGAQASSPATAS
jgi:hypothetical protein